MCLAIGLDVSHHQTAPAGTPQPQTAPAGTTHHQTTPAGTPHHQTAPASTLHRQTAPAGTPQPQTAPTGNPHHQIAPAGTPHYQTAPAGTPHHQIAPAGTSSLVSATDVLDYDTPYAIKDVGKLGRALAVQSFFGESVLRVSTPRGDRKRELQALDPEKLKFLLNSIHHHPSFASLSLMDFQELVRKKR